MNVMSESDQSLPRKMTAVGTMGQHGQLFTVYEKNWNCKDCGQENYASRPRCFRCKKQKPLGEKNYISDPALEAATNNQVIQWQEVVDPATYQIYYYNKETGVTQWERPVEMGPAPLATGWFGRGVAGSNAAQRYKDQNQQFLSRPARKQKDFIDPRKYHLEGANEYNIWYGRFIGDMPERGAKQEAAADRCVLETDAGATKADSGGDKRKERRFFCIHFAHGVCAKGKDCAYYHRIPTPEDDARCDELFDCFGRQRHSAHRDDMDGVGSFMKPCRTLFIGNLLKHKYASPKALEDAMWRHFGEWGELESLNVIVRLSIAFPRYRLRTSAEFAKEAMQGQALDHGEILSVRWAFDDPNPVAQDSISRADKDALTALLTAKGVAVQPSPFEYPSDYNLPAGKKLRLEDGTEVSSEYPELVYPDTDNQYATSAPVPVSSDVRSDLSGVMSQAEYDAYCQHYFAQILAGNTSNTATSSSSSTATANVVEASKPPLSSFLSSLLETDSATRTLTPTAEAPAPLTEAASKAAHMESQQAAQWTEHIDEDTGATYYYNSITGDSSWEQPLS